MQKIGSTPIVKNDIKENKMLHRAFKRFWP